MGGRGWGVEVSATSAAPRLGVLRASCCRSERVMQSQILQETSCDCVPIQSVPPSWSMSHDITGPSGG